MAFFEDYSTCHSLLFLPMICIKCNILLLSLAASLTFLYYLIMQQFQQEKSQVGWGTPVFLTIIPLWHTKHGHMSFSQGSRVVFVCLCACARSYAWSDKNIIKMAFLLLMKVVHTSELPILQKESCEYWWKCIYSDNIANTIKSLLNYFWLVGWFLAFIKVFILGCLNKHAYIVLFLQN